MFEKKNLSGTEKGPPGGVEPPDGVKSFGDGAAVDGTPPSGDENQFTIPWVIDLLRDNGVPFPGVIVRDVSELQKFQDGDYVVKAAVTTKGKKDKGMVVVCNRDGLEAAYARVRTAMEKSGKDLELGVLVQPRVEAEMEMLVSVRNTDYGTETIVKAGGSFAEQATTTVRVIGQKDRNWWTAQLRKLPEFR